jgi:AraC-like DNA-binding protein
MKAKADEAKYMISENQKFNRALWPNQWFVGQCH